MSQEGRYASPESRIFNLCPAVTVLVRKVEKINEKVISASNGTLFNGFCIKEGFLPNYTDIYIYI